MVMANNDTPNVLRMAKLNVSYEGQNGDLPDDVGFDLTDGELRTIVAESLRTGHIPGIRAYPDADLSDFVIDRFEPNDSVPTHRLMLRPKTPFGGLGIDPCTCGHSFEEHGNDSETPNACNEDDCDCIHYEADPQGDAA